MMEEDSLFPASAVARLSAGVCGVGVYVETESGVRGRIVAPVRSKGGMVVWWLVRLESKGRPLREIAEPLLRVRS